MKKLSILLILFLTACSGAFPTPLSIATQQQDAAPITLPLVDAPQLTRFHFVDEVNGWGATETQVVRTDDGGVTWHNATPAALSQFGYAPSFFLDARSAWLLVPDADYINGSLVRTSDGGVTWNISAVPFAYGNLQFIDPQNGFALASLGAGAGSQPVAVYRTSDAGANWTRVYTNSPDDPAANDSLPLSGQKYGITFIDASRGWIGGNAPIDNFIYLYRTRDGGETWSEASLALPAEYQSAQTGNAAPQFFSQTDGILVVNLILPADPGFVTIVFRTTDGGETWTPGAAVPSGRPASFSSFNDGVAWGGAQFHATRDAGQTWAPVTPNVDFVASLGSIQFASSVIGWALTVNEASDPSLYKTTDGGASWTIIIP
jgi:photosystem II stability/assembly factor-like uncharacterized protein